MKLLDIFNLIGGLCLFLFGMSVMGEALERKAGGALRGILKKLTSNKAMGFLTGMVVTAIIQSSSATTVMVVGFVNSGLMTLRQSMMVIMGANIGTTVTAWILSLVGLEGESLAMMLLTPSCFSPVLALIGIVFYLFLKNEKKKDTGLILLGFSTLMFGMEAMSAAVSGLQELPGFRDLFLLFTNPLLGLLVGMVLTAIIQSSSAFTGILQALSATGQVSFGAAIPLIFGQNVGTCATTLLSCIGASKEAKRTAVVHLFFNVIGAGVWISVYCVIRAVFRPAILDQAASAAGIALIHSLFNVLCTLLMLPLTGILEKLVIKLVPDGPREEHTFELDERLFVSPSIALQLSRDVTADLAISVALGVREALAAVDAPNRMDTVAHRAARVDKTKDEIDRYLIKLSGMSLDNAGSKEVAMLLKTTGELHYISQQSLSILDCAHRLRDSGQPLSPSAQEELRLMRGVTRELLRACLSAFTGTDPEGAELVSPLARVIHDRKSEIHGRYIRRLQRGECTVEAGIVWMDLLTCLERAADHFANISGYLLDEQDPSGSRSPSPEERQRQVYEDLCRRFVFSDREPQT